ncbi:formyltetrahydrofolate deformylase [Halovibrio salipaludis]|uniref:Formyltetrahydrofolate deformylase n=1 Tax=Halovibrio salipaludis TaxID=2032626 RepID=A0A2A2F729_9GAMM|nr:formyltetrahydrofolate deformylase [Halovibrio salipaludis]PAU80534.1 formyltetrahydrofolate deformylase [Halovibrio salipaludis]
MNRSYRLILSCPDDLGIVAAITDAVARHGGWITEAHQFADPDHGWFFMRYEVSADSLPFDGDGFREVLSPIARRFSMQWRVTDSERRQRVIIMASRESHCLSDLLYRWRSGDMAFDIPCVVSNHPDLRDFVEWHGIEFIHLPVDPENREAAFETLDSLFQRMDADTIVLARYMQILPPFLCERYRGQIINIHHSFLPSFAGANPYRQAAERGVKLIGATSHFATPDLDAGPIIEQDVVRVNHHNTVADMVQLGRDVEKTVLARALRYQLQDRVLIHGNKTVIFQ